MTPLWSPSLFLPLSLLLLVLVLLSSSAQAKRKAKVGADTVPASGELTTKDGHRCTWATAQDGGMVTLQVSCSSTPEGEGLGQAYTCRLAGRPDLCPAYAAKAAQYWKQVVGKLKKRSNACQGEGLLKTRLCKKAPADAHMKLAEHSEDTPTQPGNGGTAGEDEGRRRKNKGATAPKEEVEKEKETAEKESDGLPEGEMGGFGGEVNDEFSDMDPAANYCGEGWHTVCRFFIKFFDG